MAKAQVGDLIRITNVPEDWAYPNGAIYEVHGIAPAGTHGHLRDAVKFTTPQLDEDTNYYAYDDQYEIFRKAGEEDEDTVELPDTVEGLPYKRFIGEQDAVNPQHYKQGRVEVIDIIEDAVQGADPFEAVCQANIIKYSLRYRHKNGVEDLKKAVWYAEKLIAYLNAKPTQSTE